MADATTRANTAQNLIDVEKLHSTSTYYELDASAGTDSTL